MWIRSTVRSPRAQMGDPAYAFSYESEPTTPACGRLDERQQEVPILPGGGAMCLVRRSGHEPVSAAGLEVARFQAMVEKDPQAGALQRLSGDGSLSVVSA